MKLIIENVKTKRITTYETSYPLKTLFDNRVKIFKDVKAADMEDGYDDTQFAYFTTDILNFKTESGIYDFVEIKVKIL